MGKGLARVGHSAISSTLLLDGKETTQVLLFGGQDAERDCQSELHQVFVAPN